MTALEALVSVSVFVFALGAIVSSVQYFYRTNTYAIQQSSAVSSAQRGVDSMVKTMREAAYASDGAYPVVSIGPNEMVFYADIDADVAVEKVRYFISGITLMREITEPAGDPPVYGSAQTPTVVSETVRNVEQGVQLFRYYDMNGGLITDYTRIAYVRFVEMNVVVNVDPGKLPNQLILRSTAALRNLK